MNVLTVSWFSTGVSSAVATWLVRDKVDRIIYTHIDDQHEDSLRFLEDCRRWIGRPIEVIQSPYRSVAGAVAAGGNSYINSPKGAICTRLLKRRLRAEWELENEWFNNFRYVWGLDVNESNPRNSGDKTSRVEAIQMAMPNQQHLFPLVTLGITKEEAHGILRKAGIKRPKMYDLGYPNNNCIGCLKAKKGYWNKIRVDFPNVFKQRSQMERICNHSCMNGLFLDELDPRSGRDEGPIVEECGAMCEILESERKVAT